MRYSPTVVRSFAATLFVLIVANYTNAQTVPSNPRTVPANSQTIPLRVTLKTTAGDSLTNPTIQLYTLPDTLPFLSRVGKTGLNILPVTPNTKYLLKLSSVGFEPAEKILTVTDRPLSISITLRPGNSTLHTVPSSQTDPSSDRRTIKRSSTPRSWPTAALPPMRCSKKRPD